MGTRLEHGRDGLSTVQIALVTCVKCARPTLDGGLCSTCDQQKQHTFAELRNVLGLGPRRLKILLWLKQHPELDLGAWEIVGRIGTGESVKIGAMQVSEVVST